MVHLLNTRWIFYHNASFEQSGKLQPAAMGEVPIWIQQLPIIRSNKWFKNGDQYESQTELHKPLKIILQKHEGSWEFKQPR
jgi:hypothetical protein